MDQPREEYDLLPETAEVRAALARSVREAIRLRKLLRICESRDDDELARRRPRDGKVQR